MKAARMTGDWNKTRRMLAGSSRRLGKAIKQGTRAEGQTLKKELVKGITSQRPGGKRIDPPSPATLAVRRLQGIGGSKALSATRTLLKSIRVVEKAGKVFVGVPHEARGRDGKPLAQVAFAIEFGSGPVFIPLTPAMQRFLGFLMRNTPPRPKKAKRRGVVLRIPARPFLRLAFRQFAKDVQRRLAGQIASRMGWPQLARGGR